MVNQKGNNANLLKFRRKSEKMNASPIGDESGNSPEQRYVTTSTSLGHVLMMIILGFCRRITCGIELKRRMFFYFCVIVFGGIVGDFAPPVVRAFMPIKIMKGNILNQWFVKIGWFWTLVLLTPFVVMISEIMSLTASEEQQENDMKNKRTSNLSTTTNSTHKKFSKEYIVNFLREKFVSKHLLRIVFGTICWWSMTTLFEWFELQTSVCTISAHKTQKACLASGGRWAGFDISGHTFLLLLSNLMILEECTAMIGWEPFGNQLKARQQHYQKTYRQDCNQHILYTKYIIPIRILFLCLTLLSLLWDFMLIQTALFYHTMIQKLVAFTIASSLWFLLYKIVYKCFNLSVVQIAPR